ncbi:MAG: chemotaxis protein CheX [Armatimonadetes bacterium]|nr:chemotaxis protein CheX [Armatimonadota bacterium]
MDVRLINPFIESVATLFNTMLGCGVQRGEVTVAHESGEPQHLVALIGLNGPARGTVAVSLPISTSLAVAGRLLGEAPSMVNDDVADALAEIANMIAGGAKAKLSGDGKPIDLSLPTVVTGRDYQVVYPTGAVWLDVPFTCELGSFSLRVTFEHDYVNGNRR